MWTNIFVLFEHQQQKNVGVLVFFFFKIQIPTSFFVLHLCEKEKFLRTSPLPLPTRKRQPHQSSQQRKIRLD